MSQLVSKWHPVLSDYNSRLSGFNLIINLIDRENNILEIQVLQCSIFGQDDTLSSKTQPPDFVDGGYLDMEMRFLRDMCLTKIVYTMETSILNTLCPFKLQLQTSWMGSILIGKITYWRDKNKRCLNYGDMYSEHPNSCQYDTLSSQTLLF